MLKFSAHIVLIATVLISQWYNSLVALNYELNYHYYSEVLCENQDKPELHCNGQCAFSKQMALSQEDPADTEPPVLLPSLRLFNQATAEWALNLPAPLMINLNAFNHNLPRTPYLPVDEHPPKV